ncbi:PIN domain-containing protein [Microcoleus sp. FACHB-SPT15]|uniref:type II toxin-antitoxin system VapC family toxin n=1 Tax=Microcoleus sp. FACHB-SPT15 TaxID=2692830 RepID=UPI001780E101|nr:PIN domain-containing protein [Microcoleus sp. FACHB-SPT15]MBD1809046.1 PIN domain-containing protein [Microcoleus sp. FACHB-SPT15]
MKQNIILDTSPLVAFIDKSDRFHNWAVENWKTIAIPLFTCEAVISEACFLLQRTYGGQNAVMSLLNTGTIQIPFRLRDEIGRIRELMNRYQNVPMSLADGCLVRMSELIKGSCVLTLDSDFRVYRKNRNEMIDLIIADEL